MTDIVERLRGGEPCWDAMGGGACRVRNAASGCACAMAADEITRLRDGMQAMANAMAEQVRTVRVLRAQNAELAQALREIEGMSCVTCSDIAWVAVSGPYATITKAEKERAMADIVERLRNPRGWSDRVDMISAADEIERLHALIGYHIAERGRLIDRIDERDAEIERLRAALERIGYTKAGQSGADLSECIAIARAAIAAQPKEKAHE